MKSIGVDLHKTQLTVVVLDEQGAVLEQRQLPTKCHEQIREFFASYGRDSQVAVEAVGLYQWFWELVRPLVGRLVLADPAAVATLRGRQAKTDRNDARLLAELLRAGQLPTAFVPPDHLRALRELVRHRHSLARSLATQRRCARWLLLKHNLPGPRTLTSAAFERWLRAQQTHLSAVHQFAARQRLDQLRVLERAVADAEQLIDQHVAAQADLLPQITLLETVPGFGRLTAVTVLTETGGLTRFDDRDPLSAYAGLVPRVDRSDRTVHHGHITKQGPPLLRWLLQQAAWVAIRTDPQARRIWVRISRKAGAKKAATALARKLLIYAWSVCRRGQPFHWPTTPVPAEPAVGWSYAI